MIDIGPQMVAVLIPIAAIIGTVIIIIVSMIMSMREKELKNRERILAMEKGIELPREIVKEKNKRPRYFSIRMVGYVITFTGIAIVIGLMFGTSNSRDAVWGLIPAFFGLALLLSAHLEKKEYIRGDMDN